MIQVKVLQPFEYRGQPAAPGDCLDMEAIDAAVQSHAGVVSLLHGNTYQTRQMVADISPSQYLSKCADRLVAHAVERVDASLDLPHDQPLKRRRGRPRKVR